MNLQGLFNMPLAACGKCYVVLAIPEIIQRVNDMIEKKRPVEIKCPVCHTNLIYEVKSVNAEKPST